MNCFCFLQFHSDPFIITWTNRRHYYFLISSCFVFLCLLYFNSFEKDCPRLFSVPVVNIISKNNLTGERHLLGFLGHNPSLREVKAGIQEEIEAETRGVYSPPLCFRLIWLSCATPAHLSRDGNANSGLSPSIPVINNDNIYVATGQYDQYSTPVVIHTGNAWLCHTDTWIWPGWGSTI